MKWLLITFLIPCMAQAQFPTKHSNLFIKADSIEYGYNGVWAFAGRPISNTTVIDSLQTLPLFDRYRYPGGNNSNSFNWRTGKDDDGTGQANTLDDVKTMVQATDCKVLFVLNMLTKTLADQLDELHYADSIGLVVDRVELGNEFNNVNNPGHIAFPTPQSYADTAAKWRDSIKMHYPNCKVAFIGENRRWSGGANWNSVMLTKNPDALTWHESPNLDEFYNGSVDVNKLVTAINYDFSFVGMNLVTSVPIWVTESNYTYDDNNVMSYNDQVLTSFTIAATVTRLIVSNNHTGKKMFIMRGIESSKQGAYSVGNSNITRMSVWDAMKEFENTLP
jgi:hypothetical protein